MRPLIILTGPTAVGKTALSISLAKAIGAEIISADSMQVYKEMTIGTAKILPEEMDGVTHHLIDVLRPDEEFNVTVFKEMAVDAIEGIYKRGHVPLIVGGTGFYIQALLYDVDFTEEPEGEVYRIKYEKMAEEIGPDALFEKLMAVDPESAKIIHKNNVRRVIRALSFYEMHGVKISDHNAEQKERTSPYDFRYFVLTDDRAKLYERIDQRVSLMIEQGLVDEVQKLLDAGYPSDLVSMQGLGYKEIVPYLRGECTLEEAAYIIKRDTRHFAKRQLTWFRREKEVIWLDKQNFKSDNDILREILTQSEAILPKQ